MYQLFIALALSLLLVACNDGADIPDPQRPADPEAGFFSTDSALQAAEQGLARMGDSSMSTPIPPNPDVEFRDDYEAAELDNIPDDAGAVAAREYQGLQQYLPTELEGYRSLSSPGGAEQQIDGVTLTTADQRFAGPAGHVRVVITETGGAKGMEIARSMLVPAEGEPGAVVKPIGGSAGGDGAEGATSYVAETQTSSAVLVVGDRYVVEAIATGAPKDVTQQMVDVARKVARRLPAK